jgi:hypothetical protein
MTVTIRAHFDGKVITPDETVTLPRDTPLTIHVETPPAPTAVPLEEQRAAYDALLKRATERPVPHLPDEALRRESIYEDSLMSVGRHERCAAPPGPGGPQAPGLQSRSGPE